MIQPTNMQQPYPQQGANAVSINIYNPQAYGNSATPNYATAPMQAPYAYQNSLYQMPQASLYNAPYGYPMMPQAPQMMPMAPQYPQLQAPQPGYYQQYIPTQAPLALEAPQVTYEQPVTAPEPQQMPVSVMDQPQVQVEEQQPQVQTQEQPAVDTTQQTVQPVAQTIDTDALVQGLKSADSDQKANAINEIAIYAQQTPETALQIVSEPIMNALVDIIKEDTSALEGPTDEQRAVAEKIAKGEQLTPEEDALSENLSPRDKANKNRMFALYDLAMVQKLQRDELNNYIETQKANGEQPIDSLKIQDLAGYNEIVNVIKNDTRPEVQVAAIQALGYTAEPQDRAVVEEVLKDALASENEGIKKAAAEVMEKFGPQQAEQQQAA